MVKVAAAPTFAEVISSANRIPSVVKFNITSPLITKSMSWVLMALVPPVTFALPVPASEAVVSSTVVPVIVNVSPSSA